MSERIFYDSVTASRIPRNAQGVMGYDDGAYKWSDADWKLFPNAVHVHIAVFASTNSGQVLDVERYDATPLEAPGWATMRRKAGVDPTIYCNTSTWPDVVAAFKVQGVAQPHYWIAQYDNVKVIPDGAIGKQYYNNDALGFDMSVIADYWPGVDSSPQPDGKENEMVHLDLAPHVPSVFTNPAAVNGGTSIMLASCDFADVTLRVALFKFSTRSWEVTSYPLTANGGALKLELPADVNKVSVRVDEGAGTVGVDVLA